MSNHIPKNDIIIGATVTAVLIGVLVGLGLESSHSGATDERIMLAGLFGAIVCGLATALIAYLAVPPDKPGEVKQLSPEELKKKQEEQKAGAGCIGCLSILFFLAFIGQSGGGTSSQTTSSSSGPSAPSGKVDASGRIYPGTKLYTKTGVFFGTVTQQVVYDSAHEECVEVNLAGGGRFLLKRAAIRQGNTWFTDP